MKDGWLKKVLIHGFALLGTGLTLLYIFQDRILYLPQTPIRHIRDNPKGFHSPIEWQM